MLPQAAPVLPPDDPAPGRHCRSAVEAPDHRAARQSVLRQPDAPGPRCPDRGSGRAANGTPCSLTECRYGDRGNRQTCPQSRTVCRNSRSGTAHTHHRHRGNSRTVADRRSGDNRPERSNKDCRRTGCRTDYRRRSTGRSSSCDTANRRRSRLRRATRSTPHHRSCSTRGHSTPTRDSVSCSWPRIPYAQPRRS